MLGLGSGILGFRVLGVGALGFGFRVRFLGLRVEGLGLKVFWFRLPSLAELRFLGSGAVALP